MTTYREMQQQTISRRELLVFAMVAFLLSLGVLATMFPGAWQGVVVRNREHAVIKHGIEAELVRESCDEHGPSEVWRSSSWRRRNTFFQVCDLDDGRQGIRIIVCTAAGWVEKTSFVPSGALGNGTPARILEYVSARALPFTGRLSEMCQ